MISKPGFYGIVAELDGRIAGSNFMDERSPICGIGPVSVDPEVQNHAVGRQMMQHMLDRIVAHGAPGVRLVQTAYHNRSLSLYAKLGFEIREPLSVIIGKPLKVSIPGYAVRRATEADLETCNQLCFRTHGHDRGGELQDAIGRGAARVVEHLGAITAYASDVSFFGHAVAETNRGVEALIGAASGFPAGGFLLPTRNSELFRWCLQNRLRLIHQMTLMTTGLYNEPAGAYLPSVLY